jgi:short-subunit dehydrogenase
MATSQLSPQSSSFSLQRSARLRASGLPAHPWAVVTGASSGIGQAIARQLAAQSFYLVLVARRKERLEALAQAWRGEYGIQVHCVALDLAAPGAAEALHQQVKQLGIPIQVLINNAGVGPYQSFLEADWNAHLRTVQLNALVLVELCHRFVPDMLQQAEPGYVLNVASIAAYQGAPRFSIYAATKAFNRIFSEIFHRELKGTQVSVTCTCPGGTATEFLEKNGQALKPEGRAAMMSAETVARISLEGLWARRSVVVPGRINQLACFLPRVLPRGFALTLAERLMRRAVDPTPLPKQEWGQDQHS